LRSTKAQRTTGSRRRAAVRPATCCGVQPRSMRRPAEELASDMMMTAQPNSAEKTRPRNLSSVLSWRRRKPKAERKKPLLMILSKIRTCLAPSLVVSSQDNPRRNKNKLLLRI
jgi:hypothetical protein